MEKLQTIKAVYYTLGCKLNFAETSAIGRQLTALGIEKAAAGEAAGLIVVNTCSVTELADKKCRQAIRRISRQHPGAYVIATGCYAQLRPEEVGRIEGVDLVVGNGDKDRIAEFLQTRLGALKHGETASGCETLLTPTNSVTDFSYSCSRGDRTRYFLKVQDGCDYYCSYCTIPFARGRSRSGTIERLVAYTEEAGREGGREIILTGVNIGDFGRNTGESLLDLLCALDRVQSVSRFRISSIEPNLLTDEIIAFVAESERFAPHFHIPLQSGSDAVLKLMRRRYDTALFAARIAEIRRLLPDAFIGVDLIVGARGETAELFEESCRFVESLPVSQLHVFPYSERPGTQALKIPHTTSPQEKQERSAQMLAISKAKTEAFYRSQRGTRHTVLFEHTKKGDKMYGFTENYVKVETNYRNNLVNSLFCVTLNDFSEKETVYFV